MVSLQKNFPFVVSLFLAASTLWGQRSTDVQHWTATRGSLLAERSNACSVLLSDGRAMIIGGVAGDVTLASAEFFETDGRFTAAPAMMDPRSDHACAVLPDGNVMVAGGRKGGALLNA